MNSCIARTYLHELTYIIQDSQLLAYRLQGLGQGQIQGGLLGSYKPLFSLGTIAWFSAVAYLAFTSKNQQNLAFSISLLEQLC